MTYIHIVSNDLLMSQSRRFTRVKHFEIFMSKHNLHVDTSEERKDTRFLLDKDNKIVFKVFVFDNDKHFDDKSFMKNKCAIQSHFDDMNDKLLNDKVTKITL